MPSFLLANAQSVNKKIDELELVINLNNIDIACITETWLNNDIIWYYIDNYTTYRDMTEAIVGEVAVSYVSYGAIFHVSGFQSLNLHQSNHFGYCSAPTVCPEQCHILSLVLSTTRQTLQMSTVEMWFRIFSTVWIESQRTINTLELCYLVTSTSLKTLVLFHFHRKNSWNVLHVEQRYWKKCMLT